MVDESSKGNHSEFVGVILSANWEHLQGTPTSSKRMIFSQVKLYAIFRFVWETNSSVFG